MQKAIIFDMDGTMVDNMPTHNICWQKTIAAHGRNLTEEEVIKLCYGRNEEIIERIFPGKYTPEEIQAFSEEKENCYRGVFLGRLQLIAGLPEMLEAAFKADITLSIGTAAPRANVDFVLDNLNLRHYFKVVLKSDDVVNGKPHPEVFLKVAQQLGVEPENCLVFEDSTTGAKAALNAGMKTIIITNEPEKFGGFSSVKRCVPDFTSIDIIHEIENLHTS